MRQEEFRETKNTPFDDGDTSSGDVRVMSRGGATIAKDEAGGVGAGGRGDVAVVALAGSSVTGLLCTCTAPAEGPGDDTAAGAARFMILNPPPPAAGASAGEGATAEQGAEDVVTAGCCCCCVD